MRKTGSVLGWVVGLYLVVRAVAQPFVVDVGDPTTYAQDWGGPSLAGVLAVHCLPGVVAAVLLARSVVRRRARRAQPGTGSSTTGPGSSSPSGSR